MTKQEFLAMSLPYGLKLYVYGQTRFEDYITAIEEMSSNGQIYFSGGWNNIHNNSEYFKPILRPLSDLTNPIEHKGESFIPKERLNKLFIAEMIGLNPATWSFRVVLKLIEWHFDITDLISKGEAIDVNTLDINPYK